MLAFLRSSMLHLTPTLSHAHLARSPHPLQQTQRGRIGYRRTQHAYSHAMTMMPFASFTHTCAIAAILQEFMAACCNCNVVQGWMGARSQVMRDTGCCRCSRATQLSSSKGMAEKSLVGTNLGFAAMPPSGEESGLLVGASRAFSTSLPLLFLLCGVVALLFLLHASDPLGQGMRLMREISREHVPGV